MHKILIHVFTIRINASYIYRGDYYPKLFSSDIHLSNDAYSRVLYRHFTENYDIL